VPEPAWAGFFSSHPDSKTIIAVKSEKFQRQYRIESTRAPWWDYGRNAAYYVTLCTRKRQCWFGDVVDQQMQLSGIGIIAEQCWSEIPDHFPFVELGEYVVMPNHVHGIIVIAKPDQERTPIDTGRTGRINPNRNHNPKTNSDRNPGTWDPSCGVSKSVSRKNQGTSIPNFPGRAGFMTI
jgi:REP element-mobilizing transposase RayT